jgi:DNA-binding NarL/FixJ family response regulator
MNTIFKKTITVIVADDHDFYRDGVVKILNDTKNIEVIGEAADGKSFVDICSNLCPDLAIVDIGMPEMNGIDAVKKLQKEDIKTKCIALSLHTDENIILEMMQAGAKGYVDKQSPREELINAMDTVINYDQIYLPDTCSFKMVQMIARSNYRPFINQKIEFSLRELEITELICKEFSNKEIAGELAISKRTVEGHRIRIMEKMQVRSIAGLVTYAYSNRLVNLNRNFQ